MVEEFEKEFLDFERKIEDFKIEVFLNGFYDKNNVIFLIYVGVGGIEVQDWVEMLFRMYMCWVVKKGYKVEILDILSGEEVGIKNVIVCIVGENVYGYLKVEKGVYRFVRILLFDAVGRRYIFFAVVEVLFEVEDDIDIEIKEEDFEIDIFRVFGVGGQYVNKIELVVRIKYILIGIVVMCQNERF